MRQVPGHAGGGQEDAGADDRADGRAARSPWPEAAHQAGRRARGAPGSAPFGALIGTAPFGASEDGGGRGIGKRVPAAGRKAAAPRRRGPSARGRRRHRRRFAGRRGGRLRGLPRRAGLRRAGRTLPAGRRRRRRPARGAAAKPLASGRRRSRRLPPAPAGCRARSRRSTPRVSRHRESPSLRLAARPRGAAAPAGPIIRSRRRRSFPRRNAPGWPCR